MAKRRNKQAQEPWVILTKKIPGAGDYKLAERKSTASDFVDYYAYLHYQAALRKLGRIEEFESQVKMSVLDYIGELHAEHLEIRQKATPRKSLHTEAGPMCPNRCSVILNTTMKYCPECGQRVIVGKVYKSNEV